MNESFWDAHGVEIGACAFSSILPGPAKFAGPAKNDGIDPLGIGAYRVDSEAVDESLWVGHRVGVVPFLGGAPPP